MNGRTNQKRATLSGAKVRKRIVTIVEQLPEGQAVSHGEHLSLEVRKKRFGWLLTDHHGDGRVAINCKAESAILEKICSQMPSHAHHPKFLAHHGWIGLWLDLPAVNWALVGEVLTSAYRMVAPKALVAKLGVGERA